VHEPNPLVDKNLVSSASRRWQATACFDGDADRLIVDENADIIATYSPPCCGSGFISTSRYDIV
jgi:hypothetical protein